ncbi:hypothetical protein ES705_34800 [subsurface metagenome]
MIKPYSSFRTGDFITDIHASAKSPACFKLSYSAVLKTYQAYPMILGFYGMNLCICPAHYLYRFDFFPDKISDYLDTVATHIDNSAASCLLNIPEPITMRSAVCLAGTDPENFSQCALFNGFQGL